MPIFHDQDEPPPQEPKFSQTLFVEPPRNRYLGGALGGTLLDSVFSENAIEPASGSEGDASLPCSGPKMPVLNRVELIERIKRGKSPVWPQFQNVSGTGSTLVPI